MRTASETRRAGLIPIIDHARGTGAARRGACHSQGFVSKQCHYDRGTGRRGL